MYFPRNKSSRSEVGRQDEERIIVVRGGRIRAVAGDRRAAMLLFALGIQDLLPGSVYHTGTYTLDVYMDLGLSEKANRGQATNTSLLSPAIPLSHLVTGPCEQQQQ